MNPNLTFLNNFLGELLTVFHSMKPYLLIIVRV